MTHARFQEKHSFLFFCYVETFISAWLIFGIIAAILWQPLKMFLQRIPRIIFKNISISFFNLAINSKNSFSDREKNLYFQMCIKIKLICEFGWHWVDVNLFLLVRKSKGLPRILLLAFFGNIPQKITTWSFFK